MHCAPSFCLFLLELYMYLELKSPCSRNGPGSRCVCRWILLVCYSFGTLSAILHRFLQNILPGLLHFWLVRENDLLFFLTLNLMLGFVVVYLSLVLTANVVSWEYMPSCTWCCLFILIWPSWLVWLFVHLLFAEQQ